MKLNILAIKDKVMSKANLTPLIVSRTPSPQRSMVVATECCGEDFHQKVLIKSKLVSYRKDG